MPVARLKFKDNLPFPLEIALCNRYGFAIEARDKLEGTITFSKELKAINKHAFNPDALSEVVKGELIRKVNRIVDCFENPEQYVRTIRARINNMAMCHPAPERQFILDWVTDNVVDDQ